MPTYRVIGRVAPLNQADVFRRIIANPGLDISEVPVPLMFIKDLGNGQHERTVVGLLLRLTITDDDQLEVEGTTDTLQPGCYPCGVDLSHIHMAPRDETGQEAMVFTSARLAGVTAYDPDSNLVPSFPNAHLHVELIEPKTHWLCQACFADGDGERPVPCPNCKQDETYTFDPAGD